MLESLDQARELWHAGGVFAYPTESCYGLGCNPSNPEAVERIIKLKQRSSRHGLILVADDVSRFEPFIQWPSAGIKHKVLASWPGPTSWLLPANTATPAMLTGEHTTLAVRVPDHVPLRRLCQAIGGALVSTSANPHGQAAATSVAQLHDYFGAEIDLIVAGKLGDLTRPSRIIDAVSGAIIRP